VDFVVGGVGLGALAVLLGIVLRDGGAWWTRGRRSRGGREYAAALDAVCRAGGRRLVLGGGLLVLLTVLALVAGASDGIGAAVVGVATAATAAGLAAWFARRGATTSGRWRRGRPTPMPMPRLTSPPRILPTPTARPGSPTPSIAG
jgi:hypothetical protein